MRVSGSVDEKLAFVLLNARHNRPDHEFVLVMDGHGWRPETRRWIATMARDEEGFHVVTPTGLKSWLLLRLWLAREREQALTLAFPIDAAIQFPGQQESGG
ncbi:PD-(D/E)XK nuclease superfamily protein [Nitratireductor luteus]|uniref:PD-(D/E)XK nuclease superfamily protein n=1 Tax=Nitratireductor luteus TaxID=2976980 RepID=UPI00223FBDD2|nr:PD-(D/E)XK nuclease superfamily protein [Nitratireductor luteus]